MILWTIQLEEVYKIVLNIGTYHFDFNRSNMNEWKIVRLAEAQMKKWGDAEGVIFSKYCGGLSL